MNSVISPRHRQLNIIGILLLFVLLLSVAGHADHLELGEQAAENQRCHMCQNNIDTPNGIEPVPDVDFTCLVFVQSGYQPCLYIPSDYCQPQLRAPPFTVN